LAVLGEGDGRIDLERLSENSLLGYGHLRWALAAGIVLLVLCLGNLDLLTGKAAPRWDAVDYFGPEFSLIADHIKSGRLLLWDPWVDAGTPDSAEPEFGTTSPPILLAALLSPNPQAGFVMYWMAIWTLGAMGVLVLCRHLGAPAWGGIIAAIGFAASGFYTGHAEHTSHLYSVSFIPWIMWLFDLSILRRSYWNAVQAGILFGISALGGYPVYTILAPGFLALWTIGRIMEVDQSPPPLAGRWRQLSFSVTALVLLTVVGAAVMSPAYVAFFKDTPGYSERGGTISRDLAIRSNVFPAGGISTLASPYLSLLTVPPRYFWPAEDVSMRSIYAGSLVVVFALFSLTGGSRWRWWLFLVAIAFLCCATGYQLWIRGWLYDYFPPTRYFRNAASFRTYAIVLGVILSALGTKDLASTEEKGNRVRARLFLCTIGIALAAICTFALVTRLATALPPGLTLAVVQIIVTWCGAALLAYLLWRRKSRPVIIYALLAAIAVFDGVATLRICNFILYSQAEIPFWHIMNVQHERSLDLSQAGLYRQFDPPAILNNIPTSTRPSNRNLPIKLAIMNSDMTLGNSYYMQMQNDPGLRQMALGKERIWFTGADVSGPPNGANFIAFAKRVHELGRPIVMLHPGRQMLETAKCRAGNPQSQGPTLAVNSIDAASAANVSQLIYRPNSLSFHYFATTAGWLMVTDRWAPGWKVKVNGKAQDILGADFVYRAVRVEPGDNMVEFRYRPWGWPFLLILSWGTVFVCAVGQVVIMFKSKRSKELMIRPELRSALPKQ
jgi:hypothetical protein